MIQMGAQERLTPCICYGLSLVTVTKSKPMPILYYYPDSLYDIMPLKCGVRAGQQGLRVGYGMGPWSYQLHAEASKPGKGGQSA